MENKNRKIKNPDCEKAVCAHVALKNDVPHWLVKMIAEAQSQYVKEKMSSGLLQEISLPGFGTFKPKWKKIRGIRIGVHTSTQRGNRYFRYRARQILRKNASDV